MTTLTIAGKNLTPHDCLKNDRIYLRIKKIKGIRRDVIRFLKSLTPKQIQRIKAAFESSPVNHRLLNFYVPLSFQSGHGLECIKRELNA